MIPVILVTIIPAFSGIHSSFMQGIAGTVAPLDSRIHGNDGQGNLWAY